MEERDFDVKLLPELLEERRFVEARSVLSEMNPIDIAIALGEVPEESLLKLFRILPKEIAADVFVEMEDMNFDAHVRTIVQCGTTADVEHSVGFSAVFQSD